MVPTSQEEDSAARTVYIYYSGKLVSEEIHNKLTMAGAPLSFVKQLTRLFYRLTVGLTVLLIQAGLYILTAVAAVIALAAFVFFVTWRAYTDSGGRLGWAVCACGLALLLCGAVVALGHRLARSHLGLTTLPVGDLIGMLFGRRRQGSGSGVNGGAGDNPGGGQGPAAGADNPAGGGPARAGGDNRPPPPPPRLRMAQRVTTWVS